MFRSLYKYLGLYKRLGIPTMGSFSVEQLPARLDFVNQTLHSPLPVIRFHSQGNSADKKQYEYISKELGIDITEAILKMNEISFDLREQCGNGGTAILPGIGAFKKEFGGTYSFGPLFSLQQYFPEVHAERVTRTNAQHNILSGEQEFTTDQMQEFLAEEKLPGDRWWIYALLLAGAGLAALLWYYAIN